MNNCKEVPPVCRLTEVPPVCRLTVERVTNGWTVHFNEDLFLQGAARPEYVFNDVDHLTAAVRSLLTTGKWLEKEEPSRPVPEVFDKLGLPYSGFLRYDLWTSKDGVIRRIEHVGGNDLNAIKLTYSRRERQSPKRIDPKKFYVFDWRAYVGHDAVLLRGRLTDFHCRCGAMCRGNETQYWCINLRCDECGKVTASPGGTK